MIILGKSKCSICSEVLGEGQKLTEFPAFIPNTHPLGKFSDAAFHQECLEKDPHYEWVDELYRLYQMLLNTKPRNPKNNEELDIWYKKTFKSWPPTGRIVIFEQAFPDENSDEPTFFYADKDSWDEFEKAEKEELDEIEKHQEESYIEDRKSWQYIKDDE